MPVVLGNLLAGALLLLIAFAVCALVFGLDAALFLLACAVVVWVAVRLRNLFRLWKSVKASRGDEATMAMEMARLKASLFKFLFNVVSGAVFILVIALCIRMDVGTYASFLAPLAATACAAPIMIKANRCWSRYHQNFKESLVTEALSGIFDDLKYEPHGAFDSSALEGLDFFERFTEFSGNDLIEAGYRGTRFVQGDIRLRNASRTVFSGRVVRFAFTGEFPGPVRVVQKDFTGAKVRPEGGWLRVDGDFAALAHDFDIFAYDPADAAAVLDPAMVEGIRSLYRDLVCPMAFCFVGDALFAFLFLRHDSFDVSESATLLEERNRLNRDIRVNTRFLDALCHVHWADSELARRPAVKSAACPSPGAGTQAVERVAPLSVEAARLRRTMTEGAVTAFLYCRYTVFAGYLLSLLYAFSAFHDGISLGFSYSEGAFSLHEADISILVYIFIINGFFVFPFIAKACFSSKSVIASAILSIPMLIHFLILYLNVAYG